MHTRKVPKSHFQAQFFIIFVDQMFILKFMAKKVTQIDSSGFLSVIRNREVKRRKKTLVHWNEDIQNC